MVKKYFQISTAIDYPSNRFHLGHAYEKICADVVARWKRLDSYNVHFSTGTDCHGLKIQKNADKSGKCPKEFVNEISNGFRELCLALNISHNDFIMTIEERHKLVAQSIIKKLNEKDLIYKSNYNGPYCIDCETYYTEKDLIDKKCPVHKRDVIYIEEEAYFFKMSLFQKRLINNIKNGKNFPWPEKKKNEILSRLNEPLKDLCVSRKDVKWGIEFPLDKGLTVFVWVEALINYLSTIDYPNDSYKKFWPATHFIGPDIVWHHVVIWGSMLLALDLSMPQVIVHGFINLKGEKLSKATGVTVDPIELISKYGADPVRYYLVREIVFGQDGDFLEESLIARNNNELANELGNLVSRIMNLAAKKLNGKVKRQETEINFDFSKIYKYMESYELTQALVEIFRLIQEGNKYVNKKEPWKLDGKEFEKVVYNVLELLRITSILLYPFIPESSEKIAKQLGTEIKGFKEVKFGIVKEYNINKGEILFKKIE